MKPNFLNRTEEMNFLKESYNKKGFQFLVFYGRRRVGKSELLTNFCVSKPSLYFLANTRGTRQNIERLTELAAKHFGDFKPELKNFHEFFEYLINKTKNERFIVCIDEFSYLLEKDPDLASDFQIIIDMLLKKSNLMLILCGSSISMMEKGVLSAKSPLYGRRTGQWKVNPFKIKEVYKYFKEIDFEDFVKIYCIFSNIPAYFLVYDKNKNIFLNIHEKILSKGAVLYREGEFLLKEELKEPDTYFDILKAISNVPKPSKIANQAAVNQKDLPKYTKNLLSIELVEKVNPPTVKKEKTKTTFYFIKDNFINFWFKFVYPNISLLEEGRNEEILSLIKNNFEEYISKLFENFCKKIIEEKIIFEHTNFTKISKWWQKDKEIDIIALNQDSKEILFCEFKWKENVNAEEIMKELIEKTKFVEWNNNSRKESFAIFAKSFKKKIKEFNNKTIYCFDLKDLEKMLKN
ncbi:ATP-binding protein [Candidatus Woesearchaeota archaeon]|nr:ATP-binding protein [Candidatus Woesearchaeota archaeon]